MLVYQVLPRLWADGKLNSFDKDTLAYLKGLGVTHIWFTGLPSHSSGKDFVKGDPGSPYAINNYYDVNSYLAKNKSNRIVELKNLFNRVHRVGMKILVDFVPNHLGRDYDDSKGGIPHFDYCDYDWTDTFKIDWSSPLTIPAMTDILRYWISLGADGFRCDMVELVPPESLRSVISSIKSENTDIKFIAEVYKKQDYNLWADYVGFDFLYDKSGIYDILMGVRKGCRSARELTWNWQSLGDLQPKMLNFLENHDELRCASQEFCGSVENSIALIYTALLFNKASFMLYAGQEVGENAAAEANARTSIFDQRQPASLSRLYGTIKGNATLLPEESAALAIYTKLLKLSQTPLFTKGAVYDLCYCNTESRGFDAERVFAFLRHYEGQTALVVCNLSDQERELSVRIPAHAWSYFGVLNPPAWGASFLLKPWGADLKML